jgi:hypothetical protein
MAPSDDDLDDVRIPFQEARGARLFGHGKSRAVLEVKRPDNSAAVYEARLRGYDRARERALRVRKK